MGELNQPKGWAIICSPVSGKKLGKQVVEETLIPIWNKTYEKPLSVLYTEHHRHAVDLARKYGNCEGIIVVGGDGTIHEVLEGLESIGRLGETKLGLLSQGTMNFYFVTAGLPDAARLPELVKAKSFRPSPLIKVSDNVGNLDSFSFEAFHIGKMAYNVCDAARLWRFRPGGVMFGIFLNLILDNLFPSLFCYKGKLEMIRTTDKARVSIEENFFWIVASHRNPYTGCVGNQMWVSYMTLNGFPGFGVMMDFFKPPMGHYAGLGYCFQETIACDSFQFTSETQYNGDWLGCVLDGDAYRSGNRISVVHQADAVNIVAPQSFPTSIPSKFIEIETVPPMARKWLSRNPPPKGISLYKPKKVIRNSEEHVIMKMVPLLLKIALPLYLLHRYRMHKLNSR